jgi:nucleotide-binding universal stress UspA family protein
MPILIDPPTGVGPEVLERFAELTEQVRAGDVEAQSKLRELFEENPEIYRRYGDLAAAARAAWVEFATMDDTWVAMAVSRQLAELESELARPGATRLERLLAGRVATTQLMAATADVLASTATNGTPAIRREAMERQRTAASMLLSAARSLASCQKLLTPPPSPLDLLEPQQDREPAQSARGEPRGGRFRRNTAASAMAAN